LRRCLDGAQLVRASRRIPQDGDPLSGRNHLPDQLQPLPGETGEIEEQPGDVASGAREAAGELARDWVRLQVSDDDWRAAGDITGRVQRRHADRDENINLESHEFDGESGQRFRFSVRPSVLEKNRSPLDVSDLAQTGPEALDSERRSGRRGRARMKDANPRKSPRLLRLRRRDDTADDEDCKQESGTSHRALLSHPRGRRVRRFTILTG
jgi:hypothetical protein